MKKFKSRALFIFSTILCSAILIICAGVAIHILTDRTQPAPVLAQSTPAPSASPDASQTQEPGKTIQDENREEDKPGEQELVQIQPTDAPPPDDLQESIVGPFPTTVPEEQGEDVLIPTEAPPEQGEAQPTPAEASAVELISRDEAGLDTILKLNFGSFILNQRIRELLLEGMPYTAEDMKNGIEQPYLITERFQGDIIESIAIGTSLDEVVRILGVPTFQERNMTVYKTNSYYIGFYGTDAVEMANFMPAPPPCDEDILNTILTALCVDGIYLTEWLDNSEVAYSFFESNGFIHGGGHYATSFNGIQVDTLSEVIEIYNNFEGSLYTVNSETKLRPVYNNTDFNLERLYWGFSGYSSMKDAFRENGKVSPSGKYVALYEWITSELHYFTIRLADNSAPDFEIGAATRDFEWLNDDYIVYTATFTTLPAVIRVTEDAESGENILLMEDIDEEDYFYGSFDYDFTIDEITSDTIRFKDNNKVETDEGVYLEVRYLIDEAGRFQIVK